MKRREFLAWSIKAGAALMVPFNGVGCQRQADSTAIALPDLPFAKDALEPHISSRTIEFHYGKHHQGYVGKVNTLAKETSFAGMPLESIVRKSAGDKKYSAIFNNAAQVFNHNFYWNSMRPDGGGPPKGEIMDRIQASFGSYDAFRSAFVNSATTQFGSGWTWLVKRDEALEIMSTGNAGTPIAKDISPLLVVDVWEHAYYLDYQNRRRAYVDAFLNHLVNWTFAEKNLR
jgi:Fe-Mn family superoxide dismutase